MGIGQPWGLQCKRAGTGWALVHRPQWTQDPFPTPLAGLEPTGGAYGPGQSSWPEPRRSHGGPDHKKAQSWCLRGRGSVTKARQTH